MNIKQCMENPITYRVRANFTLRKSGRFNKIIIDNDNFHILDILFR